MCVYIYDIPIYILRSVSKHRKLVSNDPEMMDEKWQKYTGGSVQSPHPTCAQGVGQGKDGTARPQCLLADIHGLLAIGWWRTCGQQHRSKLHRGWETPQLRTFYTVSAETLASTHQHVAVLDLSYS